MIGLILITTTYHVLYNTCICRTKHIYSIYWNHIQVFQTFIKTFVSFDNQNYILVIISYYLTLYLCQLLQQNKAINCLYKNKMTTIIDDLLSTDSYIELEQMIMRSQIDQLNDVSDEPLDDLTFDLMDDNFIFGDNCITAEPVANEAIPVNINDVNAMTTFTTLTSAVTIFDDICDIGIDLQFIDKLYEECPSTVNSTDLITNDLNSYNDRAFDTKPIDDKQQSAYQSFNADLMINDTDGLIFGHSYSKQKTTIEDLFPQTSATNIQNNSSSETAKRKRGRPRRMPIVEQNVIKRRRGRPSLEPEVKEIRKKIRETKASAKYRFKKKMEINIILSKKKRLETMIAKNTDIICLIKDKLMSCLPFLYNNLHFINQDVSYIRNIKSLCN